jgi:ubiquinone/menaquinone biosynthesis C-methylase UbiE
MDVDDKKNINIYTSLLEKYGEDYRALDWGSKESQELRFKILAEIGLNFGDSVLDVGCGLADFYSWIKNNVDGINYSGLDITPEMIDKSKKRFPKIEFKQGTIHDENISNQNFDFIFASGIFVFRKKEPLSYMKKTIKKMYDISIKGVAFNSLSHFSPNKSKNEFYADPSEIFQYCMSISSKVILRHDYHLSDFTIYLYKDISS